MSETHLKSAKEYKAFYEMFSHFHGFIEHRIRY